MPIHFLTLCIPLYCVGEGGCTTTTLTVVVPCVISDKHIPKETGLHSNVTHLLLPGTIVLQRRILEEQDKLRMSVICCARL